MMIQRPGMELCVSAAPAFVCNGPLADRAAEFARSWATFYGHKELPACRMDIVSAPPQHAGLGVGTQLGLSVATALHLWLDEPCPAPAILARSVARGQRSAVGAYGFAEGGLIVERGKSDDESISPLECRIDLPASWCVVLAMQLGAEGLSGIMEHAAFSVLPAVEPVVTERLIDELRAHLLPAAARGNFDEFSNSVYRYGRQAGLCFAAIQGGAYNGPQVSARVHRLRELGVAGVGQSSWGPTIYALQPDHASAERLIAQLKSIDEFSGTELILSRICNHGVQVRWSSHQ